MSLNYEFAPIDVKLEGHPRAIEAGPEAMGLWLWGKLHSRAHQTSGRLRRVAVLAAWGGKRNIMLAKRLVEAGLWLAREDGDWDIFNEDAKSAGKSKSTDRVRRHREKGKASPPDETRETLNETPPPVSETRSDETSASISLSVSNSGSSSGGAGGAPEWWAGSVEAARMELGGTIDQPGARWLEYDGAMERKGWARNHTHAVGWICAVVRRERAEAKDRARAGPKRDAEVTRQGFDENAPWIKLGDTGS